MKIENIVVGQLQVNCFISYDEDSLEAMVVDPGDEPDKIIKFIEDRKLTVSRIVCTMHISIILALSGD